MFFSCHHNYQIPFFVFVCFSFFSKEGLFLLYNNKKPMGNKDGQTKEKKESI